MGINVTLKQALRACNVTADLLTPLRFLNVSVNKCRKEKKSKILPGVDFCSLLISHEAESRRWFGISTIRNRGTARV